MTDDRSGISVGRLESGIFPLASKRAGLPTLSARGPGALVVAAVLGRPEVVEDGAGDLGAEAVAGAVGGVPAVLVVPGQHAEGDRTPAAIDDARGGPDVVHAPGLERDLRAGRQEPRELILVVAGAQVLEHGLARL